MCQGTVNVYFLFYWCYWLGVACHDWTCWWVAPCCAGFWSTFYFLGLSADPWGCWWVVNWHSEACCLVQANNIDLLVRTCVCVVRPCSGLLLQPCHLLSSLILVGVPCPPSELLTAAVAAPVVWHYPSPFGALASVVCASVSPSEPLCNLLAPSWSHLADLPWDWKCFCIGTAPCHWDRSWLVFLIWHLWTW